MTLNINSTRTLNPMHTSMDICKQPVYGLTKEIQYRYLHLSEKYFPIIADLNIEQLLLNVHG